MMARYRELLRPEDGLWVQVWPRAMGWSDLGTPARLRGWLARTDSLRRHATVVPDVAVGAPEDPSTPLSA